MPGEEFVALKKDIRENGLIEPIWLFDGKVLDGRHRYYACQETGVTPTFREYTGNDPVGFTISLNLKRRHLDGGQRAMIAADLANMPLGGAQYRSANLQSDIPQVSQSEAADMMKVSPRSVATASANPTTSAPTAFTGGTCSLLAPVSPNPAGATSATPVS